MGLLPAPDPNRQGIGIGENRQFFTPCIVQPSLLLLRLITPHNQTRGEPHLVIRNPKPYSSTNRAIDCLTPMSDRNLTRNCCLDSHFCSSGLQGQELQDMDTVMLTKRSQQILKSLDVYRSMKRKYHNVREEKERSEEVMKELGAELAQGVRRMQGIWQQLGGEERAAAEMEEEISKLVKMVEGF